jgi:hypothetical protein
MIFIFPSSQKIVFISAAELDPDTNIRTDPDTNLRTDLDTNLITEPDPILDPKL